MKPTHELLRVAERTRDVAMLRRTMEALHQHGRWDVAHLRRGGDDVEPTA